jgi:hypothetical protein
VRSRLQKEPPGRRKGWAVQSSSKTTLTASN